MKRTQKLQGLCPAVFAAVLLFAVAGCPADTSGKTASKSIIAVSGVSLAASELWLEKGRELTLGYTVRPASAANKKVTWESDDGAVAAVTDGVVTGVSESAEPVTITVTTEDGGFTDTCEVTVLAEFAGTRPTGITLSESALELNVENIGKPDMVHLTVAGAGEDGSAADSTVNWLSSDSKVAAVDKNGNVRAVSRGTATITAAAVYAPAGVTVTASCNVTVTGANVLIISGFPDDMEDTWMEAFIMEKKCSPQDEAAQGRGKITDGKYTVFLHLPRDGQAQQAWEKTGSYWIVLNIYETDFYYLYTGGNVINYNNMNSTARFAVTACNEIAFDKLKEVDGEGGYEVTFTGMEDLTGKRAAVMIADSAMNFVTGTEAKAVTTGREVFSLKDRAWGLKTGWNPQAGERYLLLLMREDEGAVFMYSGGRSLGGLFTKVDMPKVNAKDMSALAAIFNPVTLSFPGGGLTVGWGDFKDFTWFEYIAGLLTGQINFSFVIVTDMPDTIPETSPIGFALLTGSDMSSAYMGDGFSRNGTLICLNLQQENGNNRIPWNGKGSFMAGMTENVDIPDAPVYLWGKPLNNYTGIEDIFTNNAGKMYNFSVKFPVLIWDDFEMLRGLVSGDFGGGK